MTTYEIKIQGYLASHWSEWFDNLEITHHSDGCTIMTGDIPDQAALHGLLDKVRDMSLPLISVMVVGQRNRQQ